MSSPSSQTSLMLDKNTLFSYMNGVYLEYERLQKEKEDFKQRFQEAGNVHVKKVELLTSVASVNGAIAANIELLASLLRMVSVFGKEIGTNASFDASPDALRLLNITAQEMNTWLNELKTKVEPRIMRVTKRPSSSSKDADAENNIATLKLLPQQSIPATSNQHHEYSGNTSSAGIAQFPNSDVASYYTTDNNSVNYPLLSKEQYTQILAETASELPDTLLDLNSFIRENDGAGVKSGKSIDTTLRKRTPTATNSRGKEMRSSVSPPKSSSSNRNRSRK